MCLCGTITYSKGMCVAISHLQTRNENACSTKQNHYKHLSYASCHTHTHTHIPRTFSKAPNPLTHAHTQFIFFYLLLLLLLCLLVLCDAFYVLRARALSIAGKLLACNTSRRARFIASDVRCRTQYIYKQQQQQQQKQMSSSEPIYFAVHEKKNLFDGEKKRIIPMENIPRASS